MLIDPVDKNIGKALEDARREGFEEGVQFIIDAMIKKSHNIRKYRRNVDVTYYMKKTKKAHDEWKELGE